MLLKISRLTQFLIPVEVSEMANNNASTNSSFNTSGNNSVELGCKPFTAAGSVSSQVVMTTAYSLVLLLSLVGNFLIIVIFYRRYRQLKTPVNYFIVSMAVSDIFVPIFVIPRRIQEIFLGWSPWLVGGVIGDLLCRVVNFAEEVSIGVSIESMVFIAVERFWSVVYPMSPPLISNETTPRFITISWIFPIVTFSYYFVAYKLVAKNDQLYCRYGLPQVFDTWQDLWRADRIMMFVIYVAVPFVILSILYTATIVSLHRQGFNFPLNSVQSSQQWKRTKKNKQITLMLAIVVLLFFVSWTPHYLYFFVQYYSWPPEQRWSCSSIKRLYLAAKYMNYLYTTLNPFIYYTFNDSYRQGFQAVLCCQKQPLRRLHKRSRVSPLHNVSNTNV